jgi:hypothetical protein
VRIRAAKFNFYVDLSLDQFKKLEFSRDLVNWIPYEELSCNTCREDGDEDNLALDAVLTFLTKFKANNLMNPKKVLPEGLSGFVLPEGDEYDYRDKIETSGYFTSVKTHHVNLHATPDQLERIADNIYHTQPLRLYYGAEKVNEYLFQNVHDPEWSILYVDKNRRNWKNFVKDLMLKNFVRRYRDIDRANLKVQYKLDSVGLTEALTELKAFDVLLPANLEEIRIGTGLKF